MSDYDRTVARIAATQHGVVTWEQLRIAGLDADAVRRRVRAGRLHRIHPGLTTHARYLAAVLACGDGAVLSHAAAAHVLSLTHGPPPPPEVTTVGREVRVEGVTVHRTNSLHPGERCTLNGIPLTTVPRTLVDLAAGLTLEELSKAVHHAHVHHRTTPPMVEAVMARAPNRAGMGRLKQALRGDELLLSDLEKGFVALLRDAGLPLPRTNVRRKEGRVDCHWPRLGLTVELDSFRYHATRHQFEADVRRTRRADRAPLRFTWGDVFERPPELLAELAPHLVHPPQ